MTSESVLPDKNFVGIRELLEFLERERTSGAYLYRGQMKRYPRHTWKTAERTQQIEALYPQDYRFFYHEHESTDATAAMVSAAREFGRYIRDQFITTLVIYCDTIRHRDVWADSLLRSFQQSVLVGAPPFQSVWFRTAWSLAQHYGLATALTDLTFSPHVAAWFATSPWDKGAPAPELGSQGVIYCVNRARIEELLRAASTAGRVLTGETFPELFLADIRSIPSTFAKRPTAQHGASLYGFDQPLFVERAVADGVLEIFTFVHQRDENVGLARNDIVPEDDPFLPVVDAFQAARRAMKPVVTSKSGVDKDEIDADEALERVATVLRVPIQGGHQVDCIPISDRYLAFLFDGIDSSGYIRYKYLLPVFDTKNRAIVCVVSVEESSGLAGLKPEWLRAIGIPGNETLGLWSRSEHVTVELGSWADPATFRERAWPLVENVLGRIRAGEQLATETSDYPTAGET